LLTLSIIVPVYYGEDYLEELCAEIELFNQDLLKNYADLSLAEVVFAVDDAPDNSLAVLKSLEPNYGWARILTLSRNYGQHLATVAGILHSSGDWVITMDEDLQHPPSKIMEMLRKVSETGCDVVYAKPEKGAHQSLFRDTSSKLAKGLLEFLIGNKHIRKSNSFRLIRGTIARGASSVCGHQTYFDIALGWFTSRFELLRMDLTDKRFQETGESSYKFRSLVSHAWRMFLSSNFKALRFVTLISSFLVSFALLWGLTILFRKIFFFDSFDGPPGWTSLVFVQIIFGSVIVGLIGLALDYLSILVQKAHGRPQYFTVDRSIDKKLKDIFGKSER